MVNPQIPFYLDTTSDGQYKIDIWKKLSFYLSYAGLNPLSDKCGSYRIEDEGNVLTIFGKKPYKVQICYNNIFRYDEVKKTEKLRVLDYIKVQNLHSRDIPVVAKINTGEDFINHFITSINNKVTEIIAVSNLRQEEISDMNYSETYARLKSTNVLIENGVVGIIENVKDGSKRTHRIKTKILKREILMDTIESEDKILVQKPQTKDKLMKKITDIFGSPYVI